MSNLDNFKIALQKTLSKQQIIDDELLRYAYSTDASLYRMVPQLVLMTHTEDEVLSIIRLAAKFNIKLTFRTAGTSLCGQAVTNEVLVILADGSWVNHTIIDNGQQISLEPGIIGANANNYLKHYKRQIGPDPGSINAAKIGGIIANNSSGMCCGTKNNSYSTLENMRLILSDGQILDTKCKDSIAQFKNGNQNFINAILSIREQIINDNELANFIRKKFAIKNTSGYSLNAFLDFADPIKIIERLIVGSEGTLGFVSRVTLNTLPTHSFKSLNLLYGRLSELINLTVKISNLEVASVELLDSFSLKSIANITNLKPYLIELPDASYAAIMIEITEETQELLNKKIATIKAEINKSLILYQTDFTQDEKVRQLLWSARNGVLPSIAANRPLGSTVILEDVAVEIQRLSELIADMRVLFNQFGYNNAAIFGHVLSGNIHFMLTPDFTNNTELVLYDKFMHAFTKMVAKKFNGSLKAEHGSGRNISPFAIVEWGEKCWNLMWQIKNLFDPQNIFNPNVKLTYDNTLHTKYLKSFPVVDDTINRCMECGFCEPVCPSRKLSLTPRQRNAVARKITTLQGAQKLQWQKSFQYYGIATCATTSMCKTACPVEINTGAYILSQKPKYSKLLNHSMELTKAKLKVKLGNSVASIIGKTNLQNITQTLHKKFKTIPIYLDSMPKSQSHEFKPGIINDSNILLIPACPNRIFGADANYAKYPSQLILEKMGYKVTYSSANTCCGQMYHSSCNLIQQQLVQKNLSKELNHKPIAIIDNSSCSGFANDCNLPLIDINKFITANIDRSKITKRHKKLALHIDCSTAKHSFNEEYLKILHLCADEIIIPEGIKCCGFAGDKGFTVPELNASSLSNLAPQVAGCSIGVTFNRSCQIGLSHHSKIKYISFVELMLDCLT